MYAKQTYLHMTLYMSKYIYTYIIIRLYTREFGEVFFFVGNSKSPPPSREPPAIWFFCGAIDLRSKKDSLVICRGTGEGFNRARFKSSSKKVEMELMRIGIPWDMMPCAVTFQRTSLVRLPRMASFALVLYAKTGGLCSHCISISQQRMFHCHFPGGAWDDF